MTEKPCTENLFPASLIDTNVLVYANNVDSQFHRKCKAVLQKAVSGKMQAAIAIQNLVELYAVITDIKRVERPLAPTKAKDLVRFYSGHENIQIIAPTHRTIEVLGGLVAEYKPKAQSIFDCLLVATMLDNGISEIYTANAEHFNPFTSITAINPLVS